MDNNQEIEIPIPISKPLYFHIFLLEIKIKMCEIYTTLQIYFVNG